MALNQQSWDSHGSISAWESLHSISSINSNSDHNNNSPTSIKRDHNDNSSTSVKHNRPSQQMEVVISKRKPSMPSRHPGHVASSALKHFGGRSSPLPLKHLGGRSWGTAHILENPSPAAPSVNAAQSGQQIRYKRVKSAGSLQRKLVPIGFISYFAIGCLTNILSRAC
jgi:hypothetical protein